MNPRRSASVFSPVILRPAIGASFAKLDPRVQLGNPVMFVVELSAVLTSILWIVQVAGGSTGSSDPAWFTLTVSIWLWLTVIFANLAEGLAEGRGKAQANTLRSMRTDTVATLRDGTTKPAGELRPGDVVSIDAGELIPGDGTVIEGIASVY